MKIQKYNADNKRRVADNLPSLETYLVNNKNKPFEYEAIIKCGVQICEILEMLHQNNVMHVSIRPENILVQIALDGSLDFYLKKPKAIQNTTQSTKEMDWYHAPYWKDPQYQVQNDLYALGLILFWMATGGRLLGETQNCKIITDEERMRAFMKRSIFPQDVVIAGINNKLAMIIQKACSIRRQDTKIVATGYSGAKQMKNALERIRSSANVERKIVEKVEKIFTTKDYNGEQVLVIGDEYTGIADYALQETSIVELYIGKNVKTCGRGVWAKCASLKKLEVENYTTAHKEDFYGCGRLEEVNLPNCKYMDEWTFSHCETLNRVEIPKCECIPPYAFYHCEKLKNINLPMCHSVGRYAFEGCSGLKHVDLQMCEIIDCSAFEGCARLEHVDLPRCKKIGMSAFRKCGCLETLEFSRCEEVESFAFEKCGGLKHINLPALQRKGSGVFDGCWRLRQVYRTM